jgi:hypothetical protein
VCAAAAAEVGIAGPLAIGFQKVDVLEPKTPLAMQE